jgi:hypothetical protein
MPMDFSRLQDLSNDLNKKSDELNESLKAFEAKLASLRLGVTAWVSPPLEKATEVDGNEFITKLGYSKVTGSWCLTLVYDDDFSSGDPNSPYPRYTPLSQAPRDLRILAVEQLPKLLKEIEKRADEAVKEVDQAGRLIQDLQ